MSGRTYDVLYDFSAEGPEELSVKAGDVVSAVPGGDQGDGWTLVQHTGSNNASGFVPTQYIRPAAAVSASSSPTGNSPAQQQQYQQQQSGHANNSQPGSALALGSGDGSPSAATAAHGVTAATQLVTQSDAGGMQASEEFSHLFATHEVWYKQASQRRQQTFAALNHAVTDLATKAAESESKTSSLLDRIAELDSLVEDERAKWEEKLKEEQAALAAGTALLTDISSAAQ